MDTIKEKYKVKKSDTGGKLWHQLCRNQKEDH